MRGLARDALKLFAADGRAVRPGPSLLEVLEVRRPRRHVEGHLGEGRSGIEAAVQAQDSRERGEGVLAEGLLGPHMAKPFPKSVGFLAGAEGRG